MGDLIIPIAGENEPLRYSCLIDPQNNDYQFVVITRKDMSFPIWKAGQVEIFSGSSLEVRVINDEFRPKATLNGKMTINANMSSGNSEKTKFKLAEMGFQQLVISTQAPYITVGSLSFGSDVTVKQIRVSGFPASLENIGFVNYTNGIALEMDLVVNFVGESGNGFGADARLRVIGERDETANKIGYKFKTVEVDRVHIEVEQGSFSLEGDLIFFKNDTIYGNGFQGNIEAKFPAVERIQAVVIFGNMLDNTRYWFADALVVLSSGIVVAPGIEINGFGGGAYYHMKQAPKTAINENGLGVTPSGVAYVPDKNTGLGIRATMYVASSGSAQAFNGSVTLDISFFTTGGLSRVILSGEASFLTPPLNINLTKIKAKAAKIAAKAQQLEEAMGKVPGLNFDRTAVASINEGIHKLEEGNSTPGSVRATVVIDYDVAQKSLHCNLKLFVDVAGGLITGAGAGGLAGDVVLHFSPGKWYIHLGTTSQRMGMKLLGLAQTSAYLMAGDEIDAIPPPPAQVASILGEMDLSLGRNTGLIGQGKGFAMGMGLSVDTGDLTFLMFYGRFAAGLGFDMTLRNYGDDAVCEETNQKVGFDGWYAMGQVYAYVMGKIGVRVDLMFYKGDFEILSIAAAAILQAKLPNPTWMKGIVGGNFSILGGLVEGSCKFKFEIGKQCTIRGASLLSGIEVISQLTPAEGADKLDVFTSPQAVFNYEVDKNFNVNDPDLNIIRTFRVKLDKFEVSKNGVLVPGRLEWSADNKTAAYISNDVLPGQSSLQVVCRIYFQEFVRGAWVNVVVSGNVVEEIKRANFNTDKAPDYIPLSNVVYSYPIINQLYYHKGETNVSYIKLDRGQPDLFILDNKWNQEIRLTNGTTKLTGGLTYNTADREVLFTMPANVQNSKLYRWEIINTPAFANDDINANVSQVVNTTNDEGNSVAVKKQKATGSLEQLQEKSIFTANFASSSHSRFIDKYNAITRSSGWSWPIMAGVHEIGVNISGAELFDNAEILGNTSKQVKPLVQLEAEYTALWHTNMLQPIIYAGLSTGLQITHRNPNILGAPPIRNVLIGQSKLDWQLTGADIDAGNIPLGSSTGVFIYKMAAVSFGDFTALRNQVAQSGNTSSFAQQLLITPFPTMQSGNYPVFLRYSLPGRNVVTSQVQIIINRP